MQSTILADLPASGNVVLRAALGYAAAGWPVFPCKPGSKAPATMHGFKDATTSPDQISVWWTVWPDANVAIATGAPGPDVLDVDVRESRSGFAAYNRLARSGLLAGARALIETPGQGLHAYFSGTGQPCGALKAFLLDFKATGGYVLAPPSIVGGRCYRLAEQREASAPLDWQAVRRLLSPPAPARSAVRPPKRSGGIAGLVAWVAGRPEGERNSGLFWAACRAAELGHGDDLDALADAAVRAGLPPLEAYRTVDSARRRVSA